MQTINIVYDPAIREISVSGGYAGTTVDNESTVIAVTGIPLGFEGRLEFGIALRDTAGRIRHPFIELDENGECTIPDVILYACRRDYRLPTQLVLENGPEVIGSNIIVLNVRPAVNAFDSFRSAYSDQWQGAFDDVGQTDGTLYFTDLGGTVHYLDLDISMMPLPATNLVGVVPAANLPPAYYHDVKRVADDAERFALTTADVQNNDVVMVLSTQLMYYVVDENNLDNESGYLPFRAITEWGSIIGNLRDQADLRNALDAKTEVSDGIPEWRADIVYSSGAFCRVGGALYTSMVSGNQGMDPTQDDPDDPVYWKRCDSYFLRPGAVATFLCGDGTNREFVLTHNLGTYDVQTIIYDTVDHMTMGTKVQRISDTQIKVSFNYVPPALEPVRVVVYKPGQAVDSVNGQTGEVVLDADDVGLGNVDNTSDLDKPVSTATQAALDLKQDVLTFDDAPTDGSNNPVKSNGIYDALQTLEAEIDTKVDAEEGKGLSSNDFTDALKAKLDSIEPSGEVNVQSDWNVTDPEDDAYIKHKPHVVTIEEGVAQWSPSLTYQSGSITNVGGTLYVSLQGNNTGHDPTDSTGWWEEIETGGGGHTGDTEILVKSFTIGDGTTTEFTLTHNLGTLDVDVLVYENATGYPTTATRVTRPTVNQVALAFGTAPTTNQYTVIVHKLANLTIPTDTEDLTNGAGFITKAVNDLTNYYTKSQTYTKAEVDALVSVKLTFKAVDQLPTEDISTTTIYLVPAASSHTGNVKDEYIYVNGAWELIGSTEFELTVEQSSSGIEINGTALQDATAEQDGLMTAEQVEMLESMVSNIKPDWNASEGDDDEILNKPVLGTAAYVDTGTSEGDVPVLDANGKLAGSVIPSLAITEFIGLVSSKAGLVNLSTAEKGDWAIVQGDATDANNGTWILNGTYSTLTDWIQLTTFQPVTSVNGYIGDVVVTATMIGVEEGAEVNVQADWNEQDQSSDAYIRNKPRLTLGGYIGTVDSAEGLLTLEGDTGDWALVSGASDPSEDGMYILNGDPAEAESWLKVDLPGMTGKADFLTEAIEGDGTTTEFTITHNLGTLPHVTMYDGDGRMTGTLITATATTVTLSFITAPEVGENYTVVITE